MCNLWMDDCMLGEKSGRHSVAWAGFIVANFMQIYNNHICGYLLVKVEKIQMFWGLLIGIDFGQIF